MTGGPKGEVKSALCRKNVQFEPNAKSIASAEEQEKAYTRAMEESGKEICLYSIASYSSNETLICRPNSECNCKKKYDLYPSIRTMISAFPGWQSRRGSHCAWFRLRRLDFGHLARGSRKFPVGGRAVQFQNSVRLGRNKKQEVILLAR